MTRDLLTPDAVSAAIESLKGWESNGSSLKKTFTFPSYLTGIDFVNAVAKEAEAMNHHPDLHVGWRKVGVELSTHSAGGITALDIELARRMNALTD